MKDELEQDNIANSLRSRVQQLRDKLTGYDSVKQELTRAERALAAYTGETANVRADFQGNKNKLYLALQAHPEGATSAQLADETGLKQGNIAYAIDKLITDGLAGKKGNSVNMVYFPVNGAAPEPLEMHMADGAFSTDQLLQTIKAVGGKVSIALLAEELVKRFGGDLRVIKGRLYPRINYVIKHGGGLKKFMKNDVLYVQVIEK
jgi:hypothetical protein